MPSRRAALLIALAVAGCGGDDTPTSFAPLRSDYLTPLRLNVGSIEIVGTPPPGRFDADAPVPPVQALRQLAEDRLSAAGSSGKATVTLVEARIDGSRRDLSGAMALRVDVVAPDGKRSGYAEARVARTESDHGSLRAASYDIVRRMLDDMNIELEFQLRNSLRDYLETTGPAPAPAAVQQQNLPPPVP